MDDYKIVVLQPMHWQELRSIRLHSLESEKNFLYGNYEDYAARPTEYWQSLLSDKKNAILGLIVDKKLCGITAILPHWDDDSGATGYFAWSYFLPEYRGKGYHKFLSEARMKWLEHHSKYKKIISSFRHTNAPLRKIYEGNGFIFSHTTMTKWPDGTEDEEHHYVLNLNKE